MAVIATATVAIEPITMRAIAQGARVKSSSAMRASL